MEKNQSNILVIVLILIILIFSVIQLAFGNDMIGFLGLGVSIVLFYIGIINRPPEDVHPFDEV